MGLWPRGLCQKDAKKVLGCGVIGSGVQDFGVGLDAKGLRCFATPALWAGFRVWYNLGLNTEVKTFRRLHKS